ncbi:MAG: AAA family ATPase [Proteobacteria bacterium]|nr:AAA family ATPase [Pseudomonadota bacterium]
MNNKEDFRPPIVKETEKATNGTPFDFDKIEHEARVDLTIDLPAPETALKVGDDIWGTLGNFTVVMGKAKSKKTFLITSAIAAATANKLTLGNIRGTLPDGKNTVWWFDTEQSRYHVLKVARRALVMAGLSFEDANLVAYALRPYNTNERFGFINKKLSAPDGVGLVIIDGIRDILRDINSPEEATKISDALLNWTENQSHKLHIITVLHANKTDANLRGHIGTELLNKAEGIIDVSVDKKDKNISIVSCERSKNKEFEPFAFRINEQALPEICAMPTSEANRQKVKPKNLSDDAHKEMIAAIWENGEKFKTDELCPKIQFELSERDWELGKSLTLPFITYWENKKWIKNQKKGRSNQYSSII